MKKSSRSAQYFLLTFCLLFYAVLCPAQDKTTRLDTFLQGLETFSAAFEQTLLNQYGEELEKAVGVVHIRRPGMFHWAYWEPYVQYLISDGVTLWIYDEDLEQVSIRDVSSVVEDSPAAILGGDIDIAAHYVVMQEDGGEEGDWMELTPRDVDSQYSAIRLGFKDAELAHMVLFDTLGQTTQIEFLDVKRNNVLNIELFQFSIPEGVDVIDNRE